MDVSHELRTPLNAIRAPLELLLAGAAGPLSSEARALLSDAVSASAQLEDVVEHIVGWAQELDGSPLTRAAGLAAGADVEAARGDSKPESDGSL